MSLKFKADGGYLKVTIEHWPNYFYWKKEKLFNI